MNKLAVLILICLLTHVALGQDINIQSITNQQGKVAINFTIEDSNPDRRYTLRLYSSMDNYVQPLAEVIGNIGQPRLVWKITVTDATVTQVNDIVLIDAHYGTVRLAFSQIHHARM